MNDLQKEAEETSREGLSCAICGYFCNNDHHFNNWFKVEPPNEQAGQELKDKIINILYDNKTDESDEGSWIESKDFHAAADGIFALIQSQLDSAKKDAVEFAEWIIENAMESPYVGEHWIHCNKSMSTSQLFDIFKNR